MKRGVRIKDGENLSEESISKVISLLEAEKPITKKDACSMLNISYNTSRLNKIIEEHKEKITHRAEMRKRMRTEPLDIPTKTEIVSRYLSGDSLSDISNSTYRSIAVVKRVLKAYNVPIRNTSVNYMNPIFIEDEGAIKDNYKEGDLVYSARYDEPAEVQYEFNKQNGVYKLWLYSSAKFAFQPFYELADLRKVQKDLNLKLYVMDGTEVRMIISEALRKQKKQEDKRR